MPSELYRAFGGYGEHTVEIVLTTKSLLLQGIKSSSGFTMRLPLGDIIGVTDKSGWLDQVLWIQMTDDDNNCFLHLRKEPNASAKEVKNGLLAALRQAMREI